jgi:hypothetical protein
LAIVDISWLRRAYPTAFLAIFDPSASERPLFRLECFNAGANMVAHDIDSLLRTFHEAVIPAGTNGGRMTCPYCQLTNLTDREMWFHCPAYHINYPNGAPLSKICPICSKPVRQPMQVI